MNNLGLRRIIPPKDNFVLRETMTTDIPGGESSPTPEIVKIPIEARRAALGLTASIPAIPQGDDMPPTEPVEAIVTLPDGIGMGSPWAPAPSHIFPHLDRARTEVAHPTQLIDTVDPQEGVEEPPTTPGATTRRGERVKYRVIGFIIGGLILTGLAGLEATHHDGPDEGGGSPITNPSTTPVHYDKLCRKVETPVEPLDERTPSISEERLGLLTEKIWALETPEEIEQALNDVMAEWGTTVHLNSVPEEVDGFKLKDDPSDLDDKLKVVKISAAHYLEGVAEVPAPLLHASKVYLTTGMTMNGDPISQYYFGNPGGKPTFLIGIGVSEKTKDITRDLHAWDIILRTCTTTKGFDDKQFSFFNQGTSYGSKSNSNSTYPYPGVFIDDVVPPRLLDDKHAVTIRLLKNPNKFRTNFSGYNLGKKGDEILQEIAASLGLSAAQQLASDSPYAHYPNN